MCNAKLHESMCLLLWLLLGSLLSAEMQARPYQKPDKPVGDSNFDQQGFLKVNGTARLIIGLYELPTEDEKLKEIADNGFNLVRVSQDTHLLDRVYKHKLYAWLCLDSAAQLATGDDKAEQRLTAIVDRFKNHPALLVWELPDEAVWNIWWSRFRWVGGEQQRELRGHIEAAKSRMSGTEVAELLPLLERAEDYSQRGLYGQAEEIYTSLWAKLGLKNPHPDWKMSLCPAEADKLTEATARGCRLVRQVDPKHIIWQNHAPRNSVERLRKYNQAVDAVGCDIYPVPFNYGVGHSDLKDTNLSSVGAYTDRMRQAAPGKSIWMVLQGFGWRDLSESGKTDPDPSKGRRPNLGETRFMAYDAIVHGANAILYWGTHYIEEDNTLWRDLMKVGRELRALEPAILGQPPKRMPTVTADETYGSIDGQGPRLMLRKTQDQWVLLAVNEHSQGISFAISNLPDELEGRTLCRLYSDEAHIVRQRTLRDGIRGFGVHIYATSRHFEELAAGPVGKLRANSVPGAGPKKPLPCPPADSRLCNLCQNSAKYSQSDCLGLRDLSNVCANCNGFGTGPAGCPAASEGQTRTFDAPVILWTGSTSARDPQSVLADRGSGMAQ